MDRLKLGVGREIITPKVGSCLYGYAPDVISTSVNDDLTLTAFYFVQGDEKALMISASVCEMNTLFTEEIIKLLSSTYDVPMSNIMICATHTHSGPNVAGGDGWGDIDKEYCDDIFLPKIMSACKTAISSTTFVTMASTFGESLVGVNRRQLRVDNAMDLGQNPLGCLNKKMTVVSFKDDDDNIVANIVHYGCHGTSAGQNTEITRDWIGIMIDALENESGAPSAFFNGTMGDIGPRISNGKTVGDITYVRELGEKAANDVIDIYRKPKEFYDVELKALENSLKIPLKPRMTLSEAETLYEVYKGKNVNLDGLKRSCIEKVLELINSGVPEMNECEIKQSVLMLGDIVFTGIPFEMFSEIGFRIDEAVKEKNVLCVSNTNGFEGYFVTEGEICLGGYEVEVFKYGRTQEFYDNADWYLVRQMAEGIEKTVKSEV